MSNYTNSEALIEMFVFEALQLMEQLEQSILNSEKTKQFDQTSIDEIFRTMHTIKGSSSMMQYNSIAKLTHSMEDVFDYLRNNPNQLSNHSQLTDIVLEVIDFINLEVTKIQNGFNSDGDPATLVDTIYTFLFKLREAAITLETVSNVQHENEENHENGDTNSDGHDLEIHLFNHYEALLFFEDGCEMENVRAHAVIHNLQEIANNITFVPSDLTDNEASVEIIRQDGFKITFNTEGGLEETRDHLLKTLFLRDIELVNMPRKEISLNAPLVDNSDESAIQDIELDLLTSNQKQSMISVSVTKLDELMDLVGEMVISEAMVTQNPDLDGLSLDNFHKAARQLNKITGELQDIVMSIRMVELTTTFQRLNRIVRDMSRKLNKEVELVTIGEETEVDKNIIEQISDPLMHLIRNALDHGMEMPEERIRLSKPSQGVITLEAKNAGSEVWIIIKDDGRGLNKQKIIDKAKIYGLLHKPESELSDREIHSFILQPGFSTNEDVTEYSGRGVGMDVVAKNIQSLGGAVLIDSVMGQGTVITIKIPLTLAIIVGMTIRVGKQRYTVPITSVKQSFKLSEGDVINDPDGNEMIMIRGECHRIVRLHEIFKIPDASIELTSGIIMMVENDDNTLCLFADELLDMQQVVVKTIPAYIKNIEGIAGCALLGDGSISLILDPSGLFHY